MDCVPWPDHRQGWSGCTTEGNNQSRRADGSLIAHGEVAGGPGGGKRLAEGGEVPAKSPTVGTSMRRHGALDRRQWIRSGRWTVELWSVRFS